MGTAFVIRFGDTQLQSRWLTVTPACGAFIDDRSKQIAFTNTTEYDVRYEV